MTAAASTCERCGAALDEADPGVLRERIEMERLDHASAYEAAELPVRGRRQWFVSKPRAAGVVVSTPRHNYVRRTWRLCAACDAELARADAHAMGFQRRAAKAVAWIALAAAAVLLLLQFVWPSFYAAIGVKADRTYQPYVKGFVPPSNTPYKPPFDPATPTEAGK